MNWEQLHHNSTIVDLHSHPGLKASLFSKDISTNKLRLLANFCKGSFWPFSKRTTFPRMDEGGLDIMLSTTYVPEKEWVDDLFLIKAILFFAKKTRKKYFEPNYFDTTCTMMNDMELQVQNYNENKKEEQPPAMFCLSPEMLRYGLDEGSLCLIHSIEGAHSLQGEVTGKSFEEQLMSSETEIEEEVLANLEYFHNRGVAYITLAHFYPNVVAYPVFPYPEYGLKHTSWEKLLGRWDMNNGISEIGLKVVESMLDLGMLVDISHCTPTGRKQVYDIVESLGKTECLLSTHTGSFEINPDPYNLEDWEIKWMADHGCVIGIIFMNYWLSPIDTKLGLKYIERTADHMIKVGGDNVVGLGTDFDGFTDPPDEMTNISQLPRLTKYLTASNHFTDSQIEGVLGGNALRILMNGWQYK